MIEDRQYWTVKLARQPCRELGDHLLILLVRRFIEDDDTTILCG